MDFLGLYLLQLALIGELSITYFSMLELLRFECVDLWMVAAARISLSFITINASLTSPCAPGFSVSCMMNYFLFSFKNLPVRVNVNRCPKGSRTEQGSCSFFFFLRTAQKEGNYYLVGD